MDDKNIAKIKKFINTISDPVVIDFLDQKKLNKSGFFLRSIEFASEHAAKHGDYGYLNKIIMALGDSVYVINLIESLRRDLLFAVSTDKPFKLKKATAQQVAEEKKNDSRP